MPRRRAESSGEAGQSTVEFVALLPVLVLALIVAGQLFLFGYTMNEASNAAWAAARAGSVGERCDAAARSSLGGLSDYLNGPVACRGPTYKVTVKVPIVFPGLFNSSPLRVTRQASLPDLKD